jgi:uncharacterized protein
MSEVGEQVRLVKAVVGALEEFAQALARGAPAEPEPAAAEQPPHPWEEHALGRRQRQIVELPGMAGHEGMKTAEIAAAIDYELPNTYSALQALARSQVVEQVPAKEPQHWRLARRYRIGSRAFARVAGLVGAGEWTTAGDVSVAVRGDLRAAESVVRAGLSHRVLAEGTAEGELRRRLEEEGVRFLEDGRADPRQRVSWDELTRRGDAAEQRRRRMANGTLNYLEIPAKDLDQSASFYEDVFGWRVDRHPAVAVVEGYDQTSYPEFVDSSGHVGGGFVLGREPSRTPGLLPSIAVDSIDDTLAAVVAAGGEVVKPRTPVVEGKDALATFRDPAGNVLGLYQAIE